MTATAAAIALASVLQLVGNLVTFTQPGLRAAICARVSVVDLGPGDVPSAWIVNTDGAPHAALHVPLVELRPGCKP